MDWTVEDVVAARETLGRMLDEIGLAEFRYWVEAQDGGWQVRIECRCRADHYSTSFEIEADVLERALVDNGARRRVRRFLIDRLGDCARARQAPSAAPLDDAEVVDGSTLGSLSEFSSTAGGMQLSRPSSAPPPPPSHAMSHADGPDASRRELYWYALEQATQDPHGPESDLLPAEEAALHIVGEE